jgi:hypothetical protein
MSASYESVAGLAQTLRRAVAAHGKHEEEIGQADPDWYAPQYMLDEQAGHPAATGRRRAHERL